MTLEESQSNHNIRILYVEDNAVDIELTRRALRKSAPFIQMDVVSSQKDALAALEQSEEADYDLVLADRNLPDGDGLSLLTHIRGRNIPTAVVLITGGGDEELVVAALKAGADDYIIKRGDYLTRLTPTLLSVLDQVRAHTTRREQPLRVLYAENNVLDMDLTRRYLETHAPNIQLETVFSAEEVLRMLDQSGWEQRIDLLLLDFRLLGLNALELIKELRQVRQIDLPIVLVTGQGAEEVALQAMKLGAADYVPKTANYLSRLPLVVEDAIYRAKLRREQLALRDSEKRYRSLFTDAPIAMVEEDFSAVVNYLRGLHQSGVTDMRVYLDEHPEEVTTMIRMVGILEMNGAAKTLFGVRGDGIPSTFLPDLLRPENDEGLCGFKEELLFIDSGKTSFTRETRNYTLDGRDLYVTVHWMALSDLPSQLNRVIVAVDDITERKLYADRIQSQLQKLNALRAIDIAISSNMDLRVTLRVLLEQMQNLLNINASAILLYHPERHSLEYVSHHGFQYTIPKNVNLPLGTGFAGIAALHRQSLTTFDLEHETGNFPPGLELFPAALAKEGFKTCMTTLLITKGELQGVLEVYLNEGQQDDEEWSSFLESLAGQAAIAIDNARLFEELQRSNAELMLAYDATIVGWTRALDLRDNETEGHTQRVVDLTMRLCELAGIFGEDLLHVRRGALLHDIGKMGVPDAILHKPGPLNDEEWEVMHRHPVYAFEMLSPITYLRPALDIPYCHHEHWDGQGYPRGLRGTQIPLAARLFAVVDVWDALTSDRPYRSAWDHEQTRAYILSESGKQFDPWAVKLFMQLIDGMNGSSTNRGEISPSFQQKQ